MILYHTHASNTRKSHGQAALQVSRSGHRTTRAVRVVRANLTQDRPEFSRLTFQSEKRQTTLEASFEALRTEEFTC